MTLPSFLGLGAMRSGTGWLDLLLRRHPSLYLPARCKEIHFFDRHYDRGVDWYETFFPEEEEAAKYAQIGEITPKYLYHPEVPARIKRLLPECRFLIILRNPAQRAYSHFKQLVQHCGVERSFQEQLRVQPELFERGFYARQIKRYFGLFARENFHFLFFEQAVRSPANVFRELAEFLSVEVDQFALHNGGGRRKVNDSSLPRFPRTHLFGKRLARGLRRCNQAWLVRGAARAGLRKFFRDGKPFPPLDTAICRELLAQYADDISELEALLHVDLGFWLNGAGTH